MTTFAVNPMDVYSELGYMPHRGQRPVLCSDARFRVVSAGRRFGKSDLGGHELVVEALIAKGLAKQYKERGKRREFWIVGPEYTDSEKEFRVLWNELRKLEVPFDKPGSYNNPEGGFMHLSLWGGAFQVHAKSAKHPDTLVGEGLHGVILAEAAKLKEIVWVKYIRPMLADFSGWALMTSTPEGKNWFYERWNAGQSSGRSEWSSWRVPSWMNPHVYKTPTKGPHVRQLLEHMRDPKFRMTAEEAVPLLGYSIDPEIIGLMDDLTPEAFLQEISADFTEFVGRVFKEFDEEWHVADLEYNPGYQHYAAVDYGFTNPNVWLFIQVDPWGNIEILDEIYKSGLTPDEFADEIVERGLQKVRRFYPDPASPSDTAILERRLRVPSAGGTGGELADRIDAIRAVLKVRPVVAHLPLGHEERLPRLRIDRRRCPNMIREMSAYRYPERKDTILGNEAHEKPKKEDDHTPEAFGRFLAGWEGTPAHIGGSRNSHAKLPSGKTRRM